MRVGVLQACRIGGACEPLHRADPLRVPRDHAGCAPALAASRRAFSVRVIGTMPPLVRDDDVRIFQIDRLALEVASIPGETGDRPCPARDLDGLGVPRRLHGFALGIEEVRAVLGQGQRAVHDEHALPPGAADLGLQDVAGRARAALPRGLMPDQPSPCLSTHLPWHTRCMLVASAEGASDGRRRPRLGAATGRRRRSGAVADGIGRSRSYRPRDVEPVGRNVGQPRRALYNPAGPVSLACTSPDCCPPECASVRDTVRQRKLEWQLA